MIINSNEIPTQTLSALHGGEGDVWRRSANRRWAGLSPAPNRCRASLTDSAVYGKTLNPSVRFWGFGIVNLTAPSRYGSARILSLVVGVVA